MKFQKGISLLLCMSMVLGCLTGCGDNAESENIDEQTNEYPFKIEDLDGYVFTVADSNVSRWFPEEGSSDIANAVINRVDKVEELFNCTIERIDFNEEEAQNAANAGSKYADIVVCETWMLGRFLKARRLLDLAQLEGLNLDTEYWQRYGSVNILQYQDKIYAVGAPCACQHDEAFVMFFNKAIIEELDLESPYDLYARDEWTMSKLLEYCQAAKKDLNGDGVFDGNDRYGFVCGHSEDGPGVLYNGAGKKFIREGEDGHFEFELNTKDAFRVVNQISEILDPFENAYDTYSLGMEPPDIVNLFVNGQTLFYCYSRGRGFADPIYDMTDDFGVVPMPRGDDSEPDGYQCWVSHDAPIMGIFANNPDIEKTVMIVEALAYFAQEENEIEENEYLNLKLRDDTAREIVKNINKYAMADYAWIGQQCAGGFYNLVNVLRDVTMKDRSKKIMSSIQAIEKEVETGIQELEDIMLQKDTVQ